LRSPPPAGLAGADRHPAGERVSHADPGGAAVRMELSATAIRHSRPGDIHPGRCVGIGEPLAADTASAGSLRCPEPAGVRLWTGPERAVATDAVHGTGWPAGASSVRWRDCPRVVGGRGLAASRSTAPCNDAGNPLVA